jgi:hypothetical protein
VGHGNALLSEAIGPRLSRTGFAGRTHTVTSADQGQHIFSATPNTSSNQTIPATDPQTGTSTGKTMGTVEAPALARSRRAGRDSDLAALDPLAVDALFAADL